MKWAQRLELVIFLDEGRKLSLTFPESRVVMVILTAKRLQVSTLLHIFKIRMTGNNLLFLSINQKVPKRSGDQPFSSTWVRSWTCFVRVVWPLFALRSWGKGWHTMICRREWNRFGITGGTRSCCRRGIRGGTFLCFWRVFSGFGCRGISAWFFIFLFPLIFLSFSLSIYKSHQITRYLMIEQTWKDNTLIKKFQIW